MMCYLFLKRSYDILWEIIPFVTFCIVRKLFISSNLFFWRFDNGLNTPLSCIKRIVYFGCTCPIFQMTHSLTRESKTKILFFLTILWLMRLCISAAMTEPWIDVFVYGTLKKLQPNHHHLLNTSLGGASYQGPFRTQESWPLIIATKANLPCLLPVKNLGKNASWAYANIFTSWHKDPS